MYKLDKQIKEDLRNAGKQKGFENLYIYLSNNCDFFCKHCYLGDRLIKKESMELDEVKEYLETWRELGSKKVCFIGGEPTLYPHLEECVDYAVKLKYEKIIVGSNGSENAGKRLLELGNGKLSYVQISLDGATEEINDYIRRKGAYKETVNTIRKLVEAGFDTRIIMTVNTYNAFEVPGMIVLAKELGVTLVKFHIMSEIGNVNTKVSDLRAVEPLKWIEICESIKEYAKGFSKRDMVISFQPAYAKKGNEDYHLKPYKGCVGKYLERMSVFPDGRCYICSFLFDYGLFYAKKRNGFIEKCNNSEFEYFNKHSCEGCIQACKYDGCAAEDIITGERTCSGKTTIFPVCRLWKIEL